MICTNSAAGSGFEGDFLKKVTGDLALWVPQQLKEAFVLSIRRLFPFVFLNGESPFRNLVISTIPLKECLSPGLGCLEPDGPGNHVNRLKPQAVS